MKTIIVDYDSGPPDWTPSGDLTYPSTRSGQWELEVDALKAHRISLRKPSSSDGWEKWEAAPSQTVITGIKAGIEGETPADGCILRALLANQHELVPLMQVMDIRHGTFIFFLHSEIVHNYTERVRKLVVETQQGKPVTVEKFIDEPRKNRMVLGMGAALLPQKDGPDLVHWRGTKFILERGNEHLGMFHALCYWLFVKTDGFYPRGQKPAAAEVQKTDYGIEQAAIIAAAVV